MTRPPAVRLAALEAWATGIAYAAGLCWASASLVASFRPSDLGAPFWSGFPALRTDTAGIAAFLTVAACFAVSEYLRLRRSQRPTSGWAADRERLDRPMPPSQPSGSLPLFALTLAKTVAVLATGLVAYISVNAVTHPATLQLRATHLATWPTEGTLRVDALAVSACAVATLRYVRASWSDRRQPYC
jgi:hypothetical protein